MLRDELLLQAASLHRSSVEPVVLSCATPDVISLQLALDLMSISAWDLHFDWSGHWVQALSITPLAKVVVMLRLIDVILLEGLYSHVQILRTSADLSTGFCTIDLAEEGEFSAVLSIMK